MKKIYKKPITKIHNVNFNYNLMEFIGTSDTPAPMDAKERNNNDNWEEF